MVKFENQSGLGSIVLAIIYGEFFPCNPLQIPSAGPRFGIRAWIVNCYFVFQSIEVGPSIPFDQVKLVGMRESPIGKPKLLVEAFRVDDEGLAFPLPDRAAVVERIVRISAKLTLLRTPIRIDNAIVAVAAANEDENSFAITVF